MVVAYWVVGGLLAVAYLAAGGMKLAQPQDKLVASGLTWAGDFPLGAVRTIGVIEVLGAIGLILPPLTGVVPLLGPCAAIGLALVQLGAIVTHLVRVEAKALPANVLLLLTAVAAAWIGFLAWA